MNQLRSCYPARPYAFVNLFGVAMMILAISGGAQNAGLPGPLLDKVQRLFPGSSVREIERDDADGEKRWEVTVLLPGSTLETQVTLLDDTTVTEIEEDVLKDGLPESVVQSIMKTFPGAEIRDAIRRHRVEITYRVDIEDDLGKKKEVRLTRHGKIRSVEND